MTDQPPEISPFDPASGDAVVAARLKRACSRRVFFATPMARHPTRQFMVSMMQAINCLNSHGIKVFVQTVVGNSNLPRARNELVAEFLASEEYSDLIFVDDDMGFTPNDVLRLLSSDQPVIGGVGCKKVDKPDLDLDKWCFLLKPGPIHQDEMGNLEVDGVGTGFLKIERRVFEALIAAHPDWKRKGWKTMPENVRAHYYRFFRFDSEDPEEIGEDFDFCREWRRIGGEVWIDPLIKLTHVGEREYSGDFTALFEIEKTELHESIAA